MTLIKQKLPKSSLQSPITYYGGKKSMLGYILPLIPAHLTYVEPFAGGLAVFFSKEPSPVEIVNDLNGFVVNFYKQLQCNYEPLNQLIQATLLSRRAHMDAYVMYTNPHLFNDLDKAWAFWVLCNQGRSGEIGKSWGNATTSDKCAKSINNKRNGFSEIMRERLKLTQIDSMDAVELIKLKDTPNTFFYIDPPYVGSDMGHYKGYTQAHFETLLNTLQNIKGKFLMSSYPNSYLKEVSSINKWHTQEIDMPTMTSPLKKRKIEVLTANFAI